MGGGSNCYIHVTPKRRTDRTRHTAPERRINLQTAPRMMQALIPPNPKELLRT